MSEKASRTILIGVVIGVLTTIGGKLLVDWLWSQPEAFLRAKVSFGPVAMPPDLPKRLAVLREDVVKDAKSIWEATDGLLTSLYSEEFLDKMSSTSPPAEKEVAKKQNKKQIDELLAGQNDVFRECKVLSSQGLKWSKDTRDEFYELLAIARRLSGYLEVVITNEGSAKADDISIDLPRFEYAVVSRLSEESKSFDQPGTLSLGSLGAQQAVKVVAWTMSDSFLDNTAERIVIRHSKGIAKIEVNAPSPIFWKKFSESMRFMWVPLLGVFGFVLLIIWILLNDHIETRVRAASISKAKINEDHVPEKKVQPVKKVRGRKNSAPD